MGFSLKDSDPFTKRNGVREPFFIASAGNEPTVIDRPGLEFQPGPGPGPGLGFFAGAGAGVYNRGFLPF